MSTSALPCSFKDPSGYVYVRDNVVFRQINKSYQKAYEHLITSSLYKNLCEQKLLVNHEETTETQNHSGNDEYYYKTIRPEAIPFISYPYEWSFGQLKEAALSTLKVLSLSLEHQMILKDASAFNIQFVGCNAVHIDTLSFDFYVDSMSWPAYSQFCRHFLAPLALMAHVDIRLNQLLKSYLDGIPLDLCSGLLPKKTYLLPGLLMHIHLHALGQRLYSGKNEKVLSRVKRTKMRRFQLESLIESLRSTVLSLKCKRTNTAWANYYQDNNYSKCSFESKILKVKEYLLLASQDGANDLAIDFGGNSGPFGRVARDYYRYVVSADVDPAATEQNYKNSVYNKEKNVLPLMLDITNPSPSLGWNNEERCSFKKRAKADIVVCLALVHHLAIANNISLPALALFFANVGEWLLLEFVPKEDSQVRRMLTSRVDIFCHYHETGFEEAFRKYFTVIQCCKLEATERTLYLMKRSTSI